MDGERPVQPTMLDVTRAWIEKYIGEVHTAFPGRIATYDRDKQTADIQPLIKLPVEQSDGSVDYEDLPQIPSVPLLLPRAAKWFVSIPLDVGDTVLVVVNELSFAYWRTTSGADVAYPGDLRRHHMANAVAIPGLFVTDKALSHSASPASAGGSNPAIVIGGDEDSAPRITVKFNGEVTITQGSDVRLKIDSGGVIALREGTTPVAKEGSQTTGHQHTLSGSAGPYSLSGTAVMTTDTIASGQGSANVQVP